MKWWVVLVTLSCALCSCRRGGAPELIGTWTTETTSPNSVHGTSATYDFKSNGTFEMSGYPPIEVKGRWQVVERSPGKLRLKLTDQEMSIFGRDKTRWSDEDDWGELTDGGRTFTYRGKIFRKSK